MKRIISVILIVSCLFAFLSCNNEKQTQGGTNGDQTSEHVCEFTVRSPKPKYIKTMATCQGPSMFYYSCICGRAGTEVFAYGTAASHDYYLMNTEQKYLLEEATVKTSAVYYKSCKCGMAGIETFTYGTPIQLTEEQKAYLPTSVTVSFYDINALTYGFNYTTFALPKNPVIQIMEEGAGEWSECIPSSYEASTLDESGGEIPFFISKAEITLKPDTVYVYRICDKDADVETPTSVLKTKSSDTTCFTFAHISDSQAGSEEFGRVMAAISDSSAFALHTGDVVQNPKFEHEWVEMLDSNYKYVTGMPIMAISGNHEMDYTNIGYQTVNRFNTKLPQQASLLNGCYYSFVYGDVKFIMLNTNELENNRLTQQQYDWLINELGNNKCKWTVVSMHNPMYSVGKYGADETRNAKALALREQLQAVFVEYGVDLVLQGHDHAISRTFPINEHGMPLNEEIETVNGTEYTVNPQGVIYLMNGPAGSQQRSPFAVDESLYVYAEASKKASYAEITVSEDSLTVTVKWVDGNTEKVYYTWGIKK